MATEILLLTAALIASAFFAGAETAITAFGDARTRKRVEDGSLSFKLWQERPDRILAAILIGNTFANVGAAAMATGIALRARAPHAVALATGVMTLLILTFAEITPKSLAKRFAAQIAPLCLPIVVLVHYALFPVVWAFSQIPRAIVRKAGVDAETRAVTSDEIEYLIGLGAKEGVLDKVRGDLLSRVLAFADTVVKEVMTPRTQIIGLDVNASLEETLALISETDLSRIPVHDGTLDNVVGVLHVKDLMAELKRGTGASGFLLSRIMKPRFFVPELMKISKLLREFQKRKVHIAIVVDEFGGTSGICTLEDVVEELVGEIRDEYDQDEEKPLKVLGDGLLLAEGSVPIRELEQYLGVDFPEDGSYETLGGFITSKAGKVPPPGSVVVWNGLKFTIKSADDRRVLKVEIAGKSAAAKGEAPPPP